MMTEMVTGMTTDTDRNPYQIELNSHAQVTLCNGKMFSLETVTYNLLCVNEMMLCINDHVMFSLSLFTA